MLKEKLFSIGHPRQVMNISSNSTSLSFVINEKNIEVLKSLSDEILFNDFVDELFDLYQGTTTSTIECVAVIVDKNTNEKYLFVKLSNDEIQRFQMNQSGTLKQSFTRIVEPIEKWNDARNQLEFYRRFYDVNRSDSTMIEEQLNEIKSKEKRKFSSSHFRFRSCTNK